MWIKTNRLAIDGNQLDVMLVVAKDGLSGFAFDDMLCPVASWSRMLGWLPYRVGHVAVVESVEQTAAPVPYDRDDETWVLACSAALAGLGPGWTA